MSHPVLKLVALCALLLPPWVEAAAQLMCGGRPITVFNSNLPESPFFILNVGNTHHLPFSMENEYFQVRCEIDRRGNERILILHVCGGSGCADQANFGIVDPRSGKVLLQPNARYRGNRNRAEAVLGKRIKLFACDTWSKTSVAESQNGEYCFVSPLELG